MSKRLRITICVVGLLGMIACSKGGALIVDDGNGGGGHINNPADTIAPVLTIHTPAPDQAFANMSTINISGNISDNLGLYRGTIKITDDATGYVLKNQAYEIHGITTYNFNVSYVTSVTTLSNYTVTVWFEDHGYNGVTKTVKVKVYP
jgi:hypothetical protein